MHWDVSTPILKSNVQQGFIQYGAPPLGNATTLDSVGNFYDAANFLVGYASNCLSLSSSRNFPSNMVMVDEYNIAKYMRITTALMVRGA